MKRILSLILVIVLLATSLCGCGKKQQNKKEDEKTESSQPITVTPEDIKVEDNFGRTVFLFDDYEKYITIGKYKGLEYPEDIAIVTDEEVDAYIDTVLKQQGYTVDTVVTDRAVQNGDTVNIDYSGKRDGVAFEGGTAQGHDLVIGSGSFIDGFESGLVGAVTGETRDLNLTFPANYGNAELAGAAVVFTVKVNSIKTTETAELTDEIVQKLSDKKTVAEFKAFAKTLLTEQQVPYDIINCIVPKLVESSKFAQLPQKELEFFRNEMINVYVTQYGLSKDDERAVSAATEAAKQYIQLYLVYLTIAKNEGMTITEDEYRTALAATINQGGYTSMEQAKSDILPDAFYLSLVYEEVAAFLIQNAVKVSN